MKLSDVSPSDLKKSYRTAIEIMKRRAVSFYQTFRCLPEERFQSVAALYAFCRYADDLVDSAAKNHSDESLDGLNRLERTIRGLYSEKDQFEIPAEEDWWIAFADSIQKFMIPIDGFLKQIDGQRKDAEFADIQTLRELFEYCRLVAGSVGKILLPLLVTCEADLADQKFIASCENLGVAMQLTNILRDVGEDLRTRNRVYLPAAMMTEYGVDREKLYELCYIRDDELVRRSIPQAFIALWEKLAGLADRFYFQFEERISWFDPACRAPLIASALVYRGIADAVRNEAYNCFTKRCYTNPATRLSLIAAAAAKADSLTN